METYARILLIAMPIFLGLVLAEKLYGYWFRRDPFRSMDTISSLSSGVTNSLKDVLGLSFTILTYGWLVDHIAVFHIKSTVWVTIIAFFALDFAGYWIHRLSHQINFFWNKHAIHHSSEEFNLACALRQSISTFVNIFTFFLIPAALFGVPGQTIAIIAPLHLFAQFWYHTVYIGKMGFLEHIIVTPSHHRVHHSINPEYLDKNHGQIFIFWDKWFGTFQEELDDVKPVYGITRPSDTWNPIKINFQHLFLLIQDALRTQSIRDKFRIWFMPTGWRPADVESKYPVKKITDLYSYQKYNPELSNGAKIWAWVQFFFVLGLVVLLYLNIGLLKTPGNLPAVLSFGAFVYLSVYSYTEFMDKNPNAWRYEFFRNGLGIYLFSFSGIWQEMVTASPLIKPSLIIYFILATALTFYLSELNKQPKLNIN
jgi:alkylglycerol monooxygenase